MANQSTTTFLTGSTGFIGQYVLRGLLDGGQRVIVLLRGPVAQSRLRLAARVVAYSEVQGKLSRVIVQAEGPGASALLSMEHGIHRLHRRQQKDLRIRVDVIDRSAASGTRQDVTVRSIRARLGRYDTELR
ncbi:MAG: SDR family oxidoreductase, partial [Planctomycetes bacterium]|nr:SDR family oxidoreductase [Planctomycetota bacterium]